MIYVKNTINIALMLACIAIGAVGGHYHGVAVTLQKLMAAQINTMEELRK